MIMINIQLMIMAVSGRENKNEENGIRVPRSLFSVKFYFLNFLKGLKQIHHNVGI
jgi:hypothetical protein